MLIINTLLLFVCPRSETVKVASVCFFILCLHCSCVLEADSLQSNSASRSLQSNGARDSLQSNGARDSLLSNGASGSKLNSFE